MVATRDRLEESSSLESSASCARFMVVAQVRAEENDHQRCVKCENEPPHKTRDAIFSLDSKSSKKVASPQFVRWSTSAQSLGLRSVPPLGLGFNMEDARDLYEELQRASLHAISVAEIPTEVLDCFVSFIQVCPKLSIFSSKL